MKVKDVMTEAPYYCQPETNLGSATELMWNADCGFLPVRSVDGKVVGVVTDRDICVALGTRNRLPGDVTAGEVMSGRVYSCAPDDDIHTALQTMKEGKVRRLPVITKNGTLVGVVSTDDVLLRAESTGLGPQPELSSDEVVRALRRITQRQIPPFAFKLPALRTGSDFC